MKIRAFHLVIVVVCAVAGGPAIAQPLPPPAAYPPDYRLPGQPVPDDGPDFDALDDDVLPPPGRAMPPRMMPDEPRYERPAGIPPPRVERDYVERAPGERRPGFIYLDDQPMRPPLPPRDIGPGQGGRPQANAAPSGDTTGALSLLPPEDRPEVGTPKELPPHLKRQEVPFATKEPPGTIIVDTANTYLYYVLDSTRAIRYGIRVGRDGFRWSGVQKITKKVEWPDWHPPTEMIERQPYLPRFMAGGPGNPLGARALYLGNTVYRIHGTNQPSTIGKRVSSGCFGLLNEDVEDLYERVKQGTRVVVLPGAEGPATASVAPPPTSVAPPTPRSGGGGAIAAEPLQPPRQLTR